MASDRGDDGDAYYLPLGDGRFAATAATVGPWGPAFQHAGPPTALLAREIERLPGPDGALLARLTIEILRPIPVGEIQVAARVVRPGRNVTLVEAELAAGGEPVVLARAWRMLTEPLPEPATKVPSPPDLPDRATEPPSAWGGDYIRSIEWRFAEGGFAPGPAVVWGRQRPALVAGERPAPLQRLLTIVDSGSGVSAALDPAHWTFVNTELSVHLHRPPEGEWHCLDAATTIGTHGVGLALTRLWDRSGPIGAAAQSLFVRSR
jgi:Thioesterase-like superfamily